LVKVGTNWLPLERWNRDQCEKKKIMGGSMSNIKKTPTGASCIAGPSLVEGGVTVREDWFATSKSRSNPQKREKETFD